MNELSEGSLIHVLPDWSAGSVTTSLLMLTRRGLLPSVNITADFLVEKLKLKSYLSFMIRNKNA